MAIRNITEGLIDKGIAVLKFDFTGLGESEGDFSETTFTSNLQDLVSASNYLQIEKSIAPTMLIGHSLGGAAVIYAAREIPSIKAYATIGAPAAPQHVQLLLKNSLEEIIEKGKAEVNIGGRPFEIGHRFIQDLEACNLPRILGHVDKPLLVIHAPKDDIVEFENDLEIFQRASAPKSFISLDGSDHLLSRKTDSLYVGRLIAEWAERYLNLDNIDAKKLDNGVIGTLPGEGYTTHINTPKHSLIADEPKKVGGDDLGPSPYELVSAGLIACTAMTVKMYSERKG